MAENQQLFCRYSTAFNRTNSGIETKIRGTAVSLPVRF